MKQQVATEHLWASLQARHAMAEYTKLEFQHHHLVAPIISYHLYRHRMLWWRSIDL
jgi:hypothetical protein